MLHTFFLRLRQFDVSLSTDEDLESTRLGLVQSLESISNTLKARFALRQVPEWIEELDVCGPLQT